MRFSKAYLGTALLLGAAVVAGCASERTVRNTVQPNIVRKADLVGQWYYLPTVVDVPYGNSATFIGDSGEVEKIVWDVEEGVLYARRAIEQINNTDKAPGQTNFVGQPIGAWRIESQFDIIRDYNAATGEESNVIRETTERPWYQREFIRVNWSTNLAGNWGFMVDKVQTQPITYYVTDPNSPEALRFERRQIPGQTDKTKTEVGYIDFTAKMFASPETVYYDGYGYIPACWFNGSQDDCTSQEIKIRHSFLKLDPTHEYEPTKWTDLDQQRFGFFEVERKTYNRQYGVTESAKQKFAVHHNIWVDPWQHNADGSYVLDDQGNKVRKAEKDRTARQLVYWANDVFPDDLKDVGAQVVKGWSDVLSEVVKHYADQSGGTMQILLADGTKTLFVDAATTPLIVWCADNPTKDSSPAACKAQAGGVGKLVREGDLRYSMIPWVDKPQRGGPLGYGPAAADPETGEALRATAYIYGAGLDSYAAWARDVVLLLNGNINVAKYVTGDNVKSFVAANFNGIRTADVARPADAASDAASKMNFSWLPKGDDAAKIPPQNAKQYRDAVIAASKKLSNSNLLGPGFDQGELRMASIQGTYLEDMLLADPEYRQMAAGVLAANGLDPTTPPSQLSAEVRRQITPTAMFGSVAMKMTHDRQVLQGQHAADMADFGEESALGLAKDYKSKFDLNTPDGQNKVWADLRAKIYLGVTQHEMGHNMGLRHNFEGTIDAMNYFKNYWDLRTQAAGGNKANIKGRFDQPITQPELDGNEQMYQYSTVMDYGAKFNSDTSGLGKYDRASLLYTYGSMVEVFNDQRNDAIIGQVSDFQTFGWPTAIIGKTVGGVSRQVAVNYSDFANLVNLEDRDVVETSTLAVDSTTGALGFAEKSGKRRVTVPYRFCSDEFAGADVTCARYDQGPDLYEIAQDYIKRYNAYYIFNNFKRDRWGWEGQGYTSRIIGRYFEPLMDQEHAYVRYKANLADFLSASDLDFLYTDAQGWKGWTLAVNDGFNMFGNVMTMPEAGSMNTTTTPLGVTMLTQTSDTPGSGVLNMALIDGRFFSTTWDFNSGYYWFERQTRQGYAMDKNIAAYILANASANYYGADTFADIRKFSINYYTIYGEQLRNTFGGLLNEDVTPMAAVYDTATSTLKRVNWADLTNTGFATPRVLGTGKLIDPMMTFTVKYISSLYGAAMFPQTFDNSFVDQSKIFVSGNGEQVTFAANQQRSWTDPLSGKTYVAFEPAGQAGTPTTIGGRLIEHARALYVPADPNAMTNYKLFIEQIDLQRSISSAFDHTRF